MSARITPLTRLGAAFLILAGGAQAQEREPSSASLPIVVGSRVRIQSREVGGRLRGLVTALDDSSFTLSPESGPPLKLRLDSLTALDTSLGRKRYTLQGLAAGALAGLIIGSRVAVDPNNCGPQTTNFCSRGEAITGFSFVFGGLGAGVGALVKSDRWAPVTLSATPQVQRGGRDLGFAIALRF